MDSPDIKGIYYNKNREEGEALAKSESDATTNIRLVRDFFKKHPNQYFARFEINSLVLPDCPPQSVTSPLFNLTELGIILKTTKMVMGDEGKQVHTWTLNTPLAQEQEATREEEREYELYLKRKKKAERLFKKRMMEAKRRKK